MEPTVDHLATFGLDRDPFSSDAQLAWYFEGAGFAAASQRLHRAALQGKGLCLVSGRGGVGKTMLVRHLLQVLDDEVFDASMLVAVPGITDMRWLLTRWAQQLGVESPSPELAAVLAQVYEQLAIVREDGRKAVLIVDEAQVLAERGVLADLRGLLNLEYEEKRLLTLILVGSPSLADAVAAEPALRDRVDARLTLQPLSPKEVVSYVHHRIRTAGGVPAIFESSAISSLTKLCGGTPRRINALADEALHLAHGAGRVSATAADVERAAAELEPEMPAPSPAAPAAEQSPAPARGERATLSAQPRRHREAPAPRMEPALSEIDADLELGEVIQEPIARRAGHAQSATALMPATRGFERDAAESGQDREFRLDDSAELEDLFADIVDE